MKKIILSAAVVSMLLASCGTMLGTGASQNNGLINTSATSQSSASSLESLIGTVLGTFLGTTTTQSIVGTWIYKQPAVQFESSNLLAQAGGALASNTVSSKLSSYYEKVGIKPGVAKCVFNSNNSCTIQLGSQTISGTYVLDTNAGTISVTSTLGIKLFTAYISISANQLSLTMDASKLLSLFQTYGSKTNDTTISAISSLSKSYSGMKTGLLFTK